MNNKLIQIGVAAIRAPDGRVIKDAPIYVPADEIDKKTAENTLIDFAAIACERMKAASNRLHIKI